MVIGAAIGGALLASIPYGHDTFKEEIVATTDLELDAVGSSLSAENLPFGERQLTIRGELGLLIIQSCVDDTMIIESQYYPRGAATEDIPIRSSSVTDPQTCEDGKISTGDLSLIASFYGT
jgi:hypothetical protein